MNETITLNDHLEKFEKEINGKWKGITDTKRRIDQRVNLLKYYYRQRYESYNYVLFELF